MMTIEQYRNTPETEISYPTNGSGYKMPQLIDDIYEAREHLLAIRHNSTHTVYQFAHLCEAIARINRALDLLEIKLKQ